MKNAKLLSGRSHPALALEVAKCLGVELCGIELGNFANGEISYRLEDSVRGHDVFILQTHSSNVNDMIMEQAVMIDAAKRASAASITAVCPFLGYARQDRKSHGREAITARLIIDILANAGADRIMSIDLHSGQVQGFYNGPFDHLVGMPTLIAYLKANVPVEDLVIVSPDAGRVKTSERYASALNSSLAIVHKHRSKTHKNSVEARYLIGDVKDKTCVLIDDMIDTAGTICAAAELLAEHGAKEIYGMATHGVLSDPAVERIEDSKFKKIIVTNTLPQETHKSAKIEVLSIAPLLAEAIKAVADRTSVSALFGGNNQT